MNDDELRQRLQAMPEPTTTIDVDAVVADARRRRRPKVVGAGVAVGAACLAFLAPVVVPGLLGPDPVTSTLQEAGVAEQGDSGAEPAAPATDADEPDASTFQTSEQPGGAIPCAALPLSSDGSGLSIAFAGPPVEGEVVLQVSNAGSEPITFRLGRVGEAVVDDGTVVAAAPVAYSVLPDPTLTVAAGETLTLSAPLVPAVECGAGGDGETVPIVALSIEGVDDGVRVVLGDPTAP